MAKIHYNKKLLNHAEIARRLKYTQSYVNQLFNEKKCSKKAIDRINHLIRTELKNVTL